MGSESYFYKVYTQAKVQPELLGLPLIKPSLGKENEVELRLFDRLKITINEKWYSVESCLFYLPRALIDARAVSNKLGISNGILFNPEVGSCDLSKAQYFFEALFEKEKPRYDFFVDNYARIFGEKNIMPGKMFYACASKYRAHAKEKSFLKISFDLDDTLICDSGESERCPSLIWRVFLKERLRHGTVEIFRWLKQIGCQVGIYTTSYRSERHIKRLFSAHGIKVDFVINQSLHERLFSKTPGAPSKNIQAFQIDLHVDDDVLLVRNGSIDPSGMLIISSSDAEWVRVVKDRVRNVLAIKVRKLDGG